MKADLIFILGTICETAEVPTGDPTMDGRWAVDRSRPIYNRAKMGPINGQHVGEIRT
jgi:hypothetical protein